MRTLIKILLFTLLALLLVGCATPKRCAELYPCQGYKETHTDTVKTIETQLIKKDTVVYIEDSNRFRLYLRCDSLGRVQLEQIKWLRESNKIKSNIKLNNNILEVQSVIDSASVFVTYYEKHIKEHLQITSNTKEAIPVVKNEPSGWQWFWIRAGQILSILFILENIIIFIKWRRK